MARRPVARPLNPAVRAEPSGIGSAGARDPLAREVKLLGALLGQVMVEQEGPELLERVERIRRLTIAHRAAPAAQRERLSRELAAELDSMDLGETEAVVRAFSLYFHLVDVAESRARVRVLGRRERAEPRGIVEGSLADAVVRLRRSGHPPEAVEALAARLRIGPVLTAHPTEARRRTLLIALRRIARLVERLDDPRLTRDEDADIRRRLREEITVLWRTAELRAVRPTPLDEVRTAMVAFDETLFTVTPRVYRALDAALDLAGGDEARSGRATTGPEAASARAAGDSGRTGTRQPRVPAFLEWGSWIGGDRDGNPFVTATITSATLAIQADHLLRGYEAVTARLVQTISAVVPLERTPPSLASRLAEDEVALPEVIRSLRARFPDEPYRIRLGAMAERLRRTRAGLTDVVAPLSGRYPDPAALQAEIVELQDALVVGGLARVAYGELAAFRWQVETFGFHLASLEVRQHSDVHTATLAVFRAGHEDPPAAVLAQELPGTAGVTAGEVLATFRAIADIQRRFGEAACHRYVVSFTRDAGDVLAVLDLARLAGLPSPGAATTGGFRPATPTLDVVPLFESSEALEDAGSIFDGLLADPSYRPHLAARGDRQVVMLGYSDSNKELGAVAANRALHAAQRALVAAAHRHGIELTLFHGRGGAIGRGGGPAQRAIRASPPGAVDGRFRVTEQGEIVAKRYLDPSIARRHLEQLGSAVLLASLPEEDAAADRAAEIGAPILDALAASAEATYRELVWDDPRFPVFFRTATPIGELAELRLGSRPASRGSRDRAAAPDVSSLRAIPWTFAWTQARMEVPGWYGLGTAVDRWVGEQGPGSVETLRELYRRWPFFAAIVDNAELSLARSDRAIAARFAALAGEAGSATWARIEHEWDRTEHWVRELTGRRRLLDDQPAIQRSIALRSPYVDPLSELQVRLLGRLHATPEDDPDRDRLRRLVQLTINGVAAGLHSTG